MQGRGRLKKPPRVRDNNGALQVRLRLDGRDYFINRLGRFDDPVAQARGQAICAEIWRDAQQGDLDLSLNRYRPLVEGRDVHLLEGLAQLSEEKKQARVTHAYRLVKRFGLPIRTRAEVDRFLVWMKNEGLAASTQSTILSTIRSVQPGNKALRLDQVKVPLRSVQEEVLSEQEVRHLLDDLRNIALVCEAERADLSKKDVDNFIYAFERWMTLKLSSENGMRKLVYASFAM